MNAVGHIVTFLPKQHSFPKMFWFRHQIHILSIGTFCFSIFTFADQICKKVLKSLFEWYNDEILQSVILEIVVEITVYNMKRRNTVIKFCTLLQC